MSSGPPPRRVLSSVRRVSARETCTAYSVGARRQPGLLLCSRAQPRQVHDHRARLLYPGRQRADTSPPQSQLAQLRCAGTAASPGLSLSSTPARLSLATRECQASARHPSPACLRRAASHPRASCRLPRATSAPRSATQRGAGRGPRSQLSRALQQTCLLSNVPLIIHNR
eukprot:scaffold663_cov358-Prasinococcus_capsulatus_cf.AAC.10